MIKNRYWFFYARGWYRKTNKEQYQMDKIDKWGWKTQSRWTRKAPLLPWHIFPLLRPFDLNAALISLLHTPWTRQLSLTTSSMAVMCNQHFHCRAHSPLLLRAAETGRRGTTARNQTSSSANVTTLNSHCPAQCVEAIKLMGLFSWSNLKCIIHQ